MNLGENLSVANYLIVYFYSSKPSEVKDNWEHACPCPLPISKESFSSSGTIELETKKRDSDEVK